MNWTRTCVLTHFQYFLFFFLLIFLTLFWPLWSEKQCEEERIKTDIWMQSWGESNKRRRGRRNDIIEKLLLKFFHIKWHFQWEKFILSPQKWFSICLFFFRYFHSIQNWIYDFYAIFNSNVYSCVCKVIFMQPDTPFNIFFF